MAKREALQMEHIYAILIEDSPFSGHLDKINLWENRLGMDTSRCFSVEYSKVRLGNLKNSS